MDADRALSFGQAAEHYDRHRPTYPRAAVEWALGTNPLRVVDLGAGTGLLTRVLLTAQHNVLPVEPDAEMRDELERVTPGVKSLDGSAERIPLPDDSVDAVVAGQAYHWFNADLAHPEIARVLKPGGTFAPMWNARDDSVSWVAELSEVAELTHDGSSAVGSGYLVDTFGHDFTTPERAVFAHSETLTADSLLKLVKSHSHYLTSAASHQAEIDEGVRALASEHPDIALHESFELPYLTYVYRARYDRSTT